MKRKYQLACALTLCGVFAPALAQAQTPVTDVCDTDVVTAGPRIYGSGGSAVTATLKAIQGAVANDPNLDPTKKLTIFYTDPVACVGWADYVSGKSTRTFRYWIAGPVDGNGKPTIVEKQCLAKTGGQPLDFAHMGNAAAECVANPDLPEGVGDFPAPIQSTNVVTHPLSNETSISAEALYFIYGFGPSGQVAPWTEGAGVFARQSTSFVTLVLGYHINLTPTQFQGPGKWASSDDTAVKTNGDVTTAITNYVGTDEAKAAQSLGYLSGSTADANRTKLKTLAFQGFGAECGVYPDSTPTAFDKLNVRLGKYPLWAQGHYFTKVDANGKPTNEHVANLVGWFDESTKPAGTTVSAFDATIKAGDVPSCAMQALREDTAGAFYSYQPPKPCTGRYEFVATGSTEHDSCEADSECGDESPFCNYGYCEAYRAEGQEEG